MGYTNAGKSTLMRALTGSEVLVANKLFATLDTTVRAIYPESVPRVLVSDTVGFIKNLPHGLVASFKSTLEEALDAALLLHVIDASDPGFQRQLEVTDEVLGEIGADEVPRIRVFNKIDHVGDEAAQAAWTAELRQRYPDCVVMSARRPEEVAQLRALIVAFFQRDLEGARAAVAVVGAAVARRHLQPLPSAGRARGRRGQLVPRARRAGKAAQPARAVEPGLAGAREGILGSLNLLKVCCVSCEAAY
ncbi:50S ribosome-binding GTPase [Chromobacterium haemolyticum]|nr:50S ribosome-binding GTPase [Chromobacterium haemolyticum]